MFVTLSLFASPAAAQDSSIEGYSTDDTVAGDRLGGSEEIPQSSEGVPTDDVAGEEFSGGGERPVDEGGATGPTTGTRGITDESPATSGVADESGGSSGVAGLPFTGLDLGLIAIGGLFLALLGYGLRRLTHSAARAA